MQGARQEVNLDYCVNPITLILTLMTLLLDKKVYQLIYPMGSFIPLRHRRFYREIEEFLLVLLLPPPSP